MLCDVLHMWYALPVMCYTCDVLVICSTYNVLWCVLPMVCFTLMFYTHDVFYSCSTCVLLHDKQRISTDVIMLGCYVLCQQMSTCVVMCYILMCYGVLCQDVPYRNNSSHNVSTHICVSSTMEHNYLSITSLWKPCYNWLHRRQESFWQHTPRDILENTEALWTTLEDSRPHQRPLQKLWVQCIDG